MREGGAEGWGIGFGHGSEGGVAFFAGHVFPAYGFGLCGAILDGGWIGVGFRDVRSNAYGLCVFER